MKIIDNLKRKFILNNIDLIPKEKNDDIKVENNYAIELKNVSFKYKKNKNASLNDASFFVEKGSFHAFIGENGAGKTTTIKLINNLVTNYEGDILINNINLRDINSLKSNVSYFYDVSVFPKNFTTYDYLLYSTLIFRNDIKKIKEEIDNYLKVFDIEENKKKFPSNLSLGQKKKVLLIKSLLEKSEIFILDEPVANLDPTTRLQFFRELKKHQSLGVTIFISTHVISEIKDYVDSVTFIKKGKIIWNGKTEGETLIEKYMNLIVGESDIITKDKL